MLLPTAIRRKTLATYMHLTSSFWLSFALRHIKIDELPSVVQGVVFNEMRSKTKVIQKPITSMDPKEFPDWSFDGSSTGQAEGNNSDCILK